jgi:hypothetical protein
VDQPQVDVPEPERVETVLECRTLATSATGRQLRRDKDLLARHATLRHCLPYLFFVAVRRCSVDVPIADLERAKDGADGAATPRLPRAEPENRHLRARSELDALLRDQPLFAHALIV